jgi:signal transduction histidine kinase/CheY-like chemotaxis protein
MTHELARAYFGKDRDALRALKAPEAFLGVLSLHWEGKLPEAYAAVDEALVDRTGLAAPFLEMLEAERCLLSVKLGRALPLHLAHSPHHSVALLVWLYARFSCYFWIDHRESHRVLKRMLWVSARVPASGMLPTTIFLIAHLLAIAGWSRIGFAVCSFIFHRCVEPRGHARDATPFSESIVFAAFPYTALVSNKMARIEDITRRCQRRLPRDPYYQTLFLLGSLYAAAYTGDVVKAEILSAHLKALHEKGAMLRYQPIAQIMPLVPLALRGYRYLVEKDFHAIVAAHKRRQSDPFINSQFYRAAALIALSMRDFAAARKHVRRAIYYREASHSFQAWRTVDCLIDGMAAQRSPVHPGEMRFFGQPLRFDSPATLGALLLEVINALPAAFTGGLAAFEERVFTLIRLHVDCPQAEARAVPAGLAEHVPQIRVGSRYLVLHGLSPERTQVVNQFFSTIAPVLGIMAASISEILELKTDNERVSRQAALAQIVQMLAHDVRRPFSMLKVGIESLRSATSPQEFRRTIDIILPDIEKASASVDGLITDVMEMGSDAPPSIQPVAPEALVEACVHEAFLMYPAADVAFDYHFGHEHMVDVDSLKVQRIFSNIVVNAIQAMAQPGRIWFRTAEVDQEGRPFVAFTIGNSGSHIPPKDVGRIFDVFFSRAKRGGTGLGLAIAQRIVVAHGGKIGCMSLEGVGVEFCFTLPRGALRSEALPRVLPRHSSEVSRRGPRASGSKENSACAVTDGLSAPDLETASESLTSAGLDVIEDGLAAAVRNARGLLDVLIVDDERVYLDALEALLLRSVASSCLRVTKAVSSNEAHAYLAATTPALTVMDVDLREGDRDEHESNQAGIEIVRYMRRAGHRGVVCVHTNAMSPDVFRAALCSGADSALPKPMSRAHLLQLLSLSLERSHGHDGDDGSRTAPLPEIALIDDSRVFLHAWRAALRGRGLVRFFVSPEAFWQGTRRDPALIERLRAVITDYRFTDSVETGTSFARAIRAYRPGLAVLLSSSGKFSESEIAGTFDGVIDKQALSWSMIAPLLGIDERS